MPGPDQATASEPASFFFSVALGYPTTLLVLSLLVPVLPLAGSPEKDNATNAQLDHQNSLVTIVRETHGTVEDNLRRMHNTARPVHDVG